MINQIKKKIIDRFPNLQKYIRFNYGLILEGIKDTDYIFGGINGITKKIIQPDGQWTPFLPDDERQSGRRVETMGCTCFSLLNATEIIAKRKGYGDWNKSDRFTAKLSGVTANGNSQSRVLDSVRKINGTVDETIWPSKIDDLSWSEYYASIPKEIQDKGLLFINDYELGYEAVWSTPAALKEALKYSPIYCAGFAWVYENGYYRSYGNPNHAFILVGYVDGKYWLAYDSYSPFLKKLAWDYRIYYPKVITLTKRGEQYNSAEIMNLIRRGFKYIMRVGGAGEIYELSPDGLKYISPEEWNNINVLAASNQKILTGVSEEYFNKLLN